LGLGGTRYTDARAASTATLDLYVQTLRYLASDGGNSILDTTSYPELLTPWTVGDTRFTCPQVFDFLYKQKSPERFSLLRTAPHGVDAVATHIVLGAQLAAALDAVKRNLAAVPPILIADSKARRHPPPPLLSPAA